MPTDYYWIILFDILLAKGQEYLAREGKHSNNHVFLKQREPGQLAPCKSPRSWSLLLVTDPKEQMVRDNFSISTWLAIGALVQSVAFSLLGRTAFLPAVCLLLYRIADAYAITTGLKHNHYLDGVILDHYSAQLPGEATGGVESPAESDVCVFMIGSKVNQYVGFALA